MTQRNQFNGFSIPFHCFGNWEANTLGVANLYMVRIANLHL